MGSNVSRKQNDQLSKYQPYQRPPSYNGHGYACQRSNNRAGPSAQGFNGTVQNGPNNYAGPSGIVVEPQRAFGQNAP